MNTHIDGRALLKTTLVAAAVLAIAARNDDLRAQPQQPPGVKIGGGEYRPLPDYPIRPKRHSDVRVTDDFWAPMIRTNAEVSIPFLVQKLGEDRGFGANVLDRMFQATGDSRFIDVMERGMYNNAIAGVSAGGNRFFYVNRLASAGDGRDLRWEKASLECCPPNLVRFFATMPAFIFAQDPKDAIYVNLYASSEATFDVADKPLGLAVKSEMPWGGKSDIHVSAKDDVKGTIKLRIPGWARNQPVPGGLYSYTDKVEAPVRIAVNGAPIPVTPDKTGYLSLERVWKNGDVVNIEFPMAVRRVVADARVKDARGRVAIERGPIVYCAEWPDMAGGKVLDLLVDAKSPLQPVVDKKLFGGVVTIQTTARSLTHAAAAAKPLTLIPYYLWANRGAGEMAVWLPTREFEPGDIGPAGGFIFYKNPKCTAI